MALLGQRLPGAKWVRPANPDLQMLYELIVDSGLRLREAYTLRAEYLQLDRGFTKVDGTKGRAGVAKPRIVPLKPGLIEKLRPYAEGKTGILPPIGTAPRKGRRKRHARWCRRFGACSLTRACPTSRSTT